MSNLLLNMSSVVIISVLLQLYYLTLNTNAVYVPEMASLNITSNGIQNFTINEYVKLKLRVTENEGGIASTDCEGTCMVNNNTEKHYESCKVIRDGNTQYLDVSLAGNLTRKDSGEWNCTFQLEKKTKQENGKVEKIGKPYSFQLKVKSPDTPFIVQDWKYVIIGTSILVLLIIIGQTICIIHFRRKAKAVKKQVQWTSRKERPEDPARYSKMPVQKIDTEGAQEATEGGIYEVLEMITVPSTPQPPPLQTLPRKGASHKSAPVTEPVADSTSQGTDTKGMMLPFNSLRSNKNSPKQPDSQRSAFDRIKERPPLPLPDDEIYEVMENSPLPPRKEIKNKEARKQGARKKEFPVEKAQKHEEFRAFTPQPRKKPVPDPVNIASTQSLKPQELSSQLKQAIHLRKRAIDVVQEPPQPQPKELPPRVRPFNPGLPPPSAPPARLASPFPRPKRSTPKPPPVVPKCKPPAPAKPKQLHPLPPTPTEPAPTPVTIEGDDENEWEDDWTYEPLPKYNIYSI